MFCRACGTQQHDNAYRCTQCGAVLQALPSPSGPVKIDNNLVLAIVATVLCCMPLGLVGVVHAAQVNARAQLGDIAGAQEYARKARVWTFWSIGVYLALIPIYVGLVFLAMLADAAK